MTLETDYIKSKLLSLKRSEKELFFEESNLNDKEIDLLKKRFINGMTIQECADLFCIEANTVSKKQHYAIKKLYQFLLNK